MVRAALWSGLRHGEGCAMVWGVAVEGEGYGEGLQVGGGNGAGHDAGSVNVAGAPLGAPAFARRGAHPSRRSRRAAWVRPRGCRAAAGPAAAASCA
eukprot:2390435-Prymnesium_polylepis.1